MTAADALPIVTNWFHEVKLASLQLPDGWFGGPGRNLHQLTAAEAWHDRLILELDKQLLIVVTAPADPMVGVDELVIDRFDQLVFDWQEFGNKRPHADVHKTGTIRFVAQARPDYI